MPAAYMCVTVCINGRRHVHVNISPAGTVFKCQTFNLLNLTWGGVQARQSLSTKCRRQDIDVKKKEQKRHENKKKIPALNPSICCRTDWSVMRRVERICSRTGGEQKVKAEGRMGWREGRWGERDRGEGGRLLLPLHNEWGEKPHIYCGGFIHFILLHSGGPEPTHTNLFYYTCWEIVIYINSIPNDLNVVITLSLS